MVECCSSLLSLFPKFTFDIKLDFDEEIKLEYRSDVFNNKNRIEY